MSNLITNTNIGNKVSFSTFYILYPGHPEHNDISVIEDDNTRIIIQKYLMLIYTKKGELFGLPDFGIDLENFLFKTRVSAKFIENIINKQIATYIPELISISYSLNISFVESERYEEIMLIEFRIGEIDVNTYVGNVING